MHVQFCNRSNFVLVGMGALIGVPMYVILSTLGVFNLLPHDVAVIHHDVVRPPLDTFMGVIYCITMCASLASTMEALWSFIGGCRTWCYRKSNHTSGNNSSNGSGTIDGYAGIGDTREAIFSAFCYISYAQGLFSNSFIIHEHHLLLFLGATLAILRAARVVACSDAPPLPVSSSLSSSLPARIWTYMGLTDAAKWALIMGLCIRYFGTGTGVGPFTPISDLPWSERIEFICSLIFLPSMLHRSLRSTQKSTTWIWRTGIVTSFIACLAAIVIYWLLYAAGPPSGTSKPSTRLHITLMVLDRLGYYIGVDGNAATSPWPALWIPRMVYIISSLGLLWVLMISPPSLAQSSTWIQRHMSPSINNRNIYSSSSAINNTSNDNGGNGWDAASIASLRARRPVPSPQEYGYGYGHDGNGSSVYSEALTSPTTPLNDPQSVMIADDVACALTAKSQAAYGMITLPLMLVLGPRSLTLGATMVMLLGALHWSRIKHTTGRPPLLGATEVMIMWCATCRLWFATGHTNDLSSLPAATAFVGFDDFNYYIGGTLLSLNTFTPHIMAAVLLPMIMGWRARQMASLSLSSSSSSSSTPPLPRVTINTITRVIDGWHHDGQYACTLFVFLFIARAALSTINAFIQRRHLMVWAIFAPKFVFDATSMLVTSLLFIIPSLAITRYWRL
jgi:hypothetical protein